MSPNPLKSSAGFTYISALVIVVIMGIMAGKAAISWKMAADREKEEELLARGAEIRDALKRWYKPRAGHVQTTPLQDLDHLLKDPRLAQNVRYLRGETRDGKYTHRLDPITNKEWVILKDPNQGIIGVASSSEAEPIKKANFSYPFQDFEGKKRYRDWEFVWNREPATRTGTGAGLPPGSTPIPGSTTQPGGTRGPATPGKFGQ